MWPHMTGGNFVADGVAVISKIGQNRISPYILPAGSNYTFHSKRREGRLGIIGEVNFLETQDQETFLMWCVLVHNFW